MTATTVGTESTTPLEKVWEPLTIKNVTLRNRIVRAAHGTGFARGPVTDTLKAYAVERARGGASLLFAESLQVHWSSPGFLDATTDDIIPQLQSYVEAIEAEGAVLFGQTMHGGPTLYAHDGSSPWGASPVADPVLNIPCRPMTKGMIREVVDGFGGMARRAKAGGLKGLEVHAGHGYIFSAFLAPATNHRTDEYGGSFENRARLLVEVLETIREQVGDDFPLGARLSPDGAEGMLSSEDVAELMELLEGRGLVDYFNLSYGSHYRRNKLIGTAREPRGYQVKQVTGSLARKTDLPVVVTGRFLTLHDAEDALRAGDADLVSMVRALIADPYLVNKTKEGRESEIRPCISCNQACAGGMNTRGLMGCVVNPATGHELTRGDHLVQITKRPYTVLVVGGGPAGLEAARSCALAGHKVILHEKADRLGGQLNLVAKSPSRPDAARMLPFYLAEMERLGIEVHLNSEITSRDEVEKMGADRVVVAIGATPRRDGFQAWRPSGPPAGFDRIEVLTGWDVLEGADVKGPVLLVDENGHFEGIDVADHLVRAGYKVHHVTRYSNLAANISVGYDYAAGPHLEELYKGDYEIYTRTLVHAVEPGKATIAPIAAPNRLQSLDVNTFVFMSGSVPDATLIEALEDIPDSYPIGDAIGPRTLEAAINEGSLAAARFEEGWTRPKWVRYAGGSSV